MIKNVVIIVLFLMCTIGSSQDYKKEIKVNFFEYLNAIDNKEFEKATQFLIPELFDIIPKSQFIESLNNTYNNSEIEYKINNINIIEIGDFQEIENKYYSMLTYSYQLNLKIKRKMDLTVDQWRKKMDDLKTSFELTDGVDNVNFNEKTQFIEIQNKESFYGVSTNGENNWKFLFINENKKTLLEKLLPKELTQNKESSSHEINKTDFIGKWISEDKEMRIAYINFEKDGYASFEIAGQALGGKEFIINGQKGKMTYVINNNVKPIELDITVTKIETGEQKKLMTCIVELKDKNSLLLGFSFENKRPTEFSPEFSVLLNRSEE